MGVTANRDFASFLDELVAQARSEEPEAASVVPLGIDLLEQVERLQAGFVAKPAEPAIAEYREFALVLEEVAARVGRDEQPPPSVEPDAIRAELGLDRPCDENRLQRLRRDFALANHPDRVAPHLRERALARMQIANMLIDEAQAARSARPRA